MKMKSFYAQMVCIICAYFVFKTLNVLMCEHAVSVYIGISDSILHYLLVSCLISLLQMLIKKTVI